MSDNKIAVLENGHTLSPKQVLLMALESIDNKDEEVPFLAVVYKTKIGEDIFYPSILSDGASNAEVFYMGQILQSRVTRGY